MKTSVLKFGGTSVKSIGRIHHVADIIAKRALENPLIVVVSAMGDTTDYLIKLAKQCVNKPDSRELDLLITTGEQISISLLTMALKSKGIKAHSFLGFQVGIFTETIHSKARIIDIKSETLEKALKDNDVIVVAGFQGITADGEITTLGRGGSDTTAVALAAAINADVCDIYTDVNGIYTTDPNLVAKASLLATISSEEVLEMARLGAQVIHPRAVELARQHKVKMRIRNTFKPEHEGTTILAEPGESDMEIYRTVSGVAIDKDQARVAILEIPDQPGVAAQVMKALADKNVVIDMIVQSYHPADGLSTMAFTVNATDLDTTVSALNSIKDKLGAKEVLADPDIAKVSIIGAGMQSQPGVAAKMFSTLGAHGINIKMISTSEMTITCVVDKNSADKAAAYIHEAFELHNINTTKSKAV